jgi:hypothetical protein
MTKKFKDKYGTTIRVSLEHKEIIAAAAKAARQTEKAYLETLIEKSNDTKRQN